MEAPRALLETLPLPTGAAPNKKEHNVPETSVRGSIGGKELILSTGKLAPQANGAVVATLGGTEMLVTATANAKPREGVDFFPLTVDFEERMYSVGRIPGSFFRREGRPSEQAILTCRLIDRPLRPSFADGYRNETHIVVTSLAVDQENPFDVVALNGASAALSVSGIPFEGPLGGVRLALKKGEWVPFPTEEELDESVFELVVAGRRNDAGEVDIVMVEAGATPEGARLVAAGDRPSDEDAVAQGLEESKQYIDQLIDLQNQLKAQAEQKSFEWSPIVDYSEEIYSRVEAAAGSGIAGVLEIPGKHDRQDAEAALAEEVIAGLGLAEDDVEGLKEAKNAFRSVFKKVARKRVIDQGVRMDGRGASDIRPLSIEVGVVERTHGSALFQRGETQVLNITTLGMLKMEQMLDTLDIAEGKRYMHHYNFPPFSTGEAGFMRGPKRREIGHGALAEKALLPVVPSSDDFPYALRLVSEVLASNGSSSMASVCGSSLSLMDAGVPILAPVAGIAMGLINEGDKFVTLTDILGAEDALGDMDFKVAGTADMITALQLDTKIQGLPSEVLKGALDQAREARLFILDAMSEVIAEPRAEMNKWAPRIESVEIPKDKIGEVIGPKGAVIRELEEVTGAKIEIEETDGVGIVRIASNDSEALAGAMERVRQIAFPPEVEVGAEYDGKVVNITKFGAFVNILPGRDGLLHISRLDGSKRVERVEDYLSEGDELKVRVREIERGKVSLELVEALEGATLPSGDAPSGGGRDRSDRNDRGRDRNGGGRGGRSNNDRSNDRNRGRNRDEPSSTDQQTSGGRRKAPQSFAEAFEEMQD
ncbi:MAG TPA: polyribonucleotide nucleotidyltransferase [Acidimicrobiia bacterium]|nr:polyribonucleotide nucleotidyltransferase [Acidimicrobiia bacterium]